MITPAFGLTATERVLPKLALDFTTATLDPRITFSRTTGASNPATYINSSGVITAATNNQPRFDYDPVTLLCKGLLIEESRTNSLLNSDALSTQSVTVTAAARTLSFYGTGQVVLSGAHSATVTGTGAYPTRTTLTFTPSAGTLTLTVTGTVQYAQLEAGAFATSYIPTTSAALTRNADVAVMTGTNFSDWFNASEGTFLAKSTVSSPTGTCYMLSANDGTTNTNIGIGQYSSHLGLAYVKDTTDQVVLSNQSFSVGSQINEVIAYKRDNFATCANAVLLKKDTGGTVPTVNRLDIGMWNALYSVNASSCWNGTIQKIMYWNLRVTDNEVTSFSK